MAQLYDEQGNLIEGALSPEEVKELQEAKEASIKEASEIKERLVKLEAKDMNFRRLEQMTEEEKAKLSVEQLEVRKQMEALADKQKEFSTKQIDSYKGNAIAALAGEDAETRDKVLKNYDRIKDDAVTPEEINRKMMEAYAMTVGTQTIANPLSVAMGFAGGQGPKKENKSFSDSAEGISFAKSLGMKIGSDNK